MVCELEAVLIVLVTSCPLTNIVNVPSLKQLVPAPENARTVTVAPLLIVPPEAVKVETALAAPCDKPFIKN